MPPKKITGISELKKQLAKEKQKKERKEKKPKVVPKGIAGGQAAKNAKVRAKEETARREFFKGLLEDQDTSSSDDLLDKLKEFGTDPKGQLFRKDFIRRITGRLSAGLIYEYAQGYISQSEDSSAFLKKFLEEPEVRKRVEAMGEERAEEEAEAEEEAPDYESEGEMDYGDEDEEKRVVKMAKSFEKILLPEEEPEEIAVPTKSELKAKLIDIGTREELPERPNVSRRYGKMKDRSCIEWYRNTPWLGSRATAIWVYFYKGGEEFYHGEDSLLENPPYEMKVRPENTKVIDGKVFRRANKKFVAAQCGFFRNRRRLQGGELLFYGPEGWPYRAEVVFEVKNKLIPQTKEIFNKEKEAYIRKNASIEKKISFLIDRTVALLSDEEKGDREKNILKNVMKKFLESSLNYAVVPSEIRKELVDPVVDVFYLEKNENSVRQLLKQFSLFLSNFDPTFLKFAQIFHGRLVRGVYSPDQLISLLPADILPEIYLDKRVSDRDKDILNEYKSLVAKEIYTQMTLDFYYENYPEAPKPFFPTRIIMAPQVDLPEEGLKGLCKNKESLPADISPGSLYVYEEDGSYYCFDLTNLPEEFSIFGENPETQHPMPDEVIDEINKLSQALKAEAEVTIPFEVRKETKEKVAPGLLELAIKDILELENEIGIKGNDLLKELEKAREVDTPEGDKKAAEVTEKIENICGYCQNFLREEGIFSSIVQGKEGSKLITFCNTECFEKMEKWPKLRKRKEELEKIEKARLEARIKGKMKSLKISEPKLPEVSNLGEECEKCRRNIPEGEERVLNEEVVCQRCEEKEMKEVRAKKLSLAQEKILKAREKSKKPVSENIAIPEVPEGRPEKIIGTKR